MQPLRLTMNGQERVLTGVLTVADLVAHAGLTPARVAVEVNQELVRRAHYGETRLRDGDQVEIVTLVGGG